MPTFLGAYLHSPKFLDPTKVLTHRHNVEAHLKLHSALNVTRQVFCVNVLQFLYQSDASVKTNLGEFIFKTKLVVLL